MARNAKRPGERSHFGMKLIFRLAIVMFVIFCAVAFIKTQNSIIERKRELASLEEKVETMTAQNEELADIIGSNDIGRYMEKIAVEQNGYAYPDERRYYDTSHN